MTVKYTDLNDGNSIAIPDIQIAAVGEDLFDCIYFNKKIQFSFDSLPKNYSEYVDSILSYYKMERIADNRYENCIGLDSLPKYEKGNREICSIPYGVKENGSVEYLDFEDSNFATFLCGASRSGKSTLLHTIIAGLIANKHPDDIEIWLVDFKKTEFSQYIDHLPAHVRYLIIDESAEIVYDIIDRLTDILHKREDLFMNRWRKLNDVPKEKYMPSIMVIIDEFSVMSQVIVDSALTSSENYRAKLQLLLQKGAALGIHFIFSSQKYSEGAAGLNPTSRDQIQQRLAMITPDFSEIKATLALKSPTQKDEALISQLKKHYVLKKVKADREGNQLRLSHVLYIENNGNLNTFIDNINQSLHAGKIYDPLDATAYIYKQPLIVDGKSFKSFDSKQREMVDALSMCSTQANRPCKLFVGEPKRMKAVLPITVYDENKENLLIIFPKKEKVITSSIILAVIKSLLMQEKAINIWSYDKNLYSFMPDHSGDSDDTILERVSSIANRIRNNYQGTHYLIIDGLDALFKLTRATTDWRNNFKHENSVTIDRRELDQVDLLTAMSFGAEPDIVKKEYPELESMKTLSKAYNIAEDIKTIVTDGPRLGYHVIAFANDYSIFQNFNIDLDSFKHKMLFRMSIKDAQEFVGRYEASNISSLEDHSFRYTCGTESITFRPFLHDGLSWDGWSILNGKPTFSVIEEEQYLM